MTFGFWNSARRCGVSTSLDIAIGPIVCTSRCFLGEERMVEAMYLLSLRMFHTIRPFPVQSASSR